MSKNVLYKFINLLLINSIHKQEKNVYKLLEKKVIARYNS